jgi:IS30 family transposase
VVVDSLNARPHKRLGFRSPNDCFSRQRLLYFT